VLSYLNTNVIFRFAACRLITGKVEDSWKRNAYEVTGISPQSITVAQLLKGFVPKGTL
jgi:hypothetical protein